MPIQTKSSFYYSLPLLWSQGWLDLPATMTVLRRLQKCSIDGDTTIVAIATSSDDPCSLEREKVEWLGPQMVKVLDLTLWTTLDIAADFPV